MSWRQRADRFLLPAILLLAYALRVFRLDYQELRGDETFGYLFSQNSWPEIIRQTIAFQEPHPVASYFVQKAWLMLAGHGEFALRFTGVWFSVLAVALLYRLARRLGLSQTVALVAAALLAISPYAVWHSQDARMYSMLLALIIASAWLGLEALVPHQGTGAVNHAASQGPDRPKTRPDVARVPHQGTGAVNHAASQGPDRPKTRPDVAQVRDRLSVWIAFVAVSWLALHTHYSAAFVLIAENLAVLGWAIAGRRGRVFGRWLASQVVLALLYLPWLWLVGRNLSAYTGNGDSPGWPAMIYRSFSALAFGETVATGLRPWYALLAGLLLCLGLFRLWRSGGSQAPAGAWLAIGLLVPLGATWLSGANRPIFNERYLVAAVPPFYLLLAAGLAAGKRPPIASTAGPTKTTRNVLTWAVAGLLTVAVLASFGSLRSYYTDPQYSKTRGWRTLAGEIRRLTGGLPSERVRVAENYPDPTLWYYYPGPADHLVLPPAAHDAAGAARDVAGLAERGVDWVVMPVYASDAWDPSGLASTALAQGFTLVDRRQVGVWPLEIYVRPDTATLQSLNTTFANGVTLSSGAFEPATAMPEGLVVVHLAWSGPASALRGTEKVFIHLADSTGRPVAQADQPLGPAQLQGITSYSIRLPADAAAGQYRVVAGIYDPGQPGAPRISSQPGGSDHVELGSLQISLDETDGLSAGKMVATTQ